MTEQEQDEQVGRLVRELRAASIAFSHDDERCNALLDQLHAFGDTVAVRALEIRDGKLWDAIRNEPRPIPSEIDMVAAVAARNTAAARVERLQERIAALAPEIP